MEDRVSLLEQRLVQKGRELALLKEMSLFLTNSVQKTLDIFAYRVGVLTNAKFVRVYLVDESYTKLRLVSGYNLSDKYLEMVKDKFEISIDSVPCGKTIKDKSPYIVNNVATDDFFSAWSNVTAMHGYSSYMAMPLFVSSRILGAADIFFEDARYFSTDETNLLSVLFNAGALAIENAILIENIEHVSVIDEPTGAYKYAHFMDTLKKEIEKANKYNQPLSVIIMQMLDASEKGASAEPIADNKAVRSFIEGVKSMVRGSDMVFKYTENIFCLVLAQTTKKFAADIVPRIHDKFKKVFGAGIDLKANIYSIPDDGADLETLIRNAVSLNQ